jgi:TPR repeat protein
MNTNDSTFQCLVSRHLLLALIGLSAIGSVSCGDKAATQPARGAQAAESKVDVNPEPSPEQVFSALLKKAESADAKAQASVGEAYRLGSGVKSDPAKSVEWFQKSASQQNADAQYALGYRYSKLGQTIYDIKIDPERLKESFGWYEKAAAQGHVKAQVAIGSAYLSGEGVRKDASKAMQIFERMAVNGDSVAQYYLGKIFAEGKAAPKNPSKTIEWYLKAASQGHYQAALELGEIFYEGKGVPKDIAAAATYYEQAASKGHPDAFYPIGYLYANGEGVPKDSVAAAKWLGKAASNGSARAQAMLGSMYSEGEGVPKDAVLAYAWMNLAAANGDAMAITGRSIYEKFLSSAEKAEAQRLTAKWQPTNGWRPVGITLERENSTPNANANSELKNGSVSKTGTGTGFFVNIGGQMVTNNHVIDGCQEVRLAGQEGVATVVTTDTVNDLALLKFSNTAKFAAPINSEPSKIRQGEDVVVFGFPLNSVLSSGGNLTPGVISALTGLGNNTNQMQITAPIQPGSSGSPVMNTKGEVVGVVSMKLSDSKMAKATGQVAQNVNFAVSGQTLKSFLDAHKVDYSGGGLLSFNKKTADLADQAKKWTTVVECWK